MIKSLNSNFILVIILVLSACVDRNEEKSVSIIPKPRSLAKGEGVFEINERTKITFLDSICSEEMIRNELSLLAGFELNASEKPENNSITFMIGALPPSEHTISISSNKISVVGGSCSSLLQGFNSIRQLILLNGTDIPSLEIVDSPQFQWRGLLLDCSRHFMEKEFVKRYIDLLALYKMNVLHWHLTEDQGWRVEIDAYPLLTEIGAWREGENGKPYGGFYTKEDINEIVSYAQDRGITVVPEIELPGHSQAALAAYPQFSCTGGPFDVETEWGVFKEIYCAGNDSTFTFLEDVLTEVIALFPSEYIHIGGDEVPKFRWEQCDQCQRRMVEEGLHDEHELQSYFIGRIGEFLSSKGKKMIGWDEILEGGLPEGAIVQSWRGFEGAKEAVRMGNQAILSPTSHAYFDYGLNDIDMEKVYSFNPIPEGITKEEASLVLGGECNMWSERAPQSKVDGKVFPRILAMTETLWNSAEKNYEEFRGRVYDQYRVLDKLGVNYGFEKVPVQVSTEMKGEELYAVLQSYEDEINMFYQQGEGKEKYYEPIQITKPERWAITFSRNGLDIKDTIFQAFKPHLANGLTPEYKSSYHENYTAKGVLGLTDGLKGSHKFRDGNWQGYWGNDVEVVLDLGKERDVSSFSSGFLQYNNAWIFFPKEVTYWVSSDGENFEEIGRVNNLISPKEKKQETQEFELKLSETMKMRYVKLLAKSIGPCPEWHDAAGSDSWLFIDEFSVN